MSSDNFQLVVMSRIDQHKADEKKKLDDERVRIAAEEKKKAEDKVRADRLAEELEASKKAAPVVLPAQEAPKPTPAKTEASVSPHPAHTLLMHGLARRDAHAFRTKYANLEQLSAVNAAIDSFLAATEERREVAEA